MLKAIAPAIVVAAVLAATAGAASAQPARACYLRADAEDPSVLSHIGLRRTRGQLYDVDIRIALGGGASCSLSGVARVRGTPGLEMLGFPVRSDLSAPRSSTQVPCQVFVQLTPTALVLALSPADVCKAQPPCDGLVELHGQRFDLGGRTDDATRGPCFAPQAFGAPLR